MIKEILKQRLKVLNMLEKLEGDVVVGVRANRDTQEPYGVTMNGQTFVGGKRDNILWQLLTVGPEECALRCR